MNRDEPIDIGFGGIGIPNKASIVVYGTKELGIRFANFLKDVDMPIYYVRYEHDVIPMKDDNIEMVVRDYDLQYNNLFPSIANKIPKGKPHILFMHCISELLNKDKDYTKRLLGVIISKYAEQRDYINLFFIEKGRQPEMDVASLMGLGDGVFILKEDKIYIKHIFSKTEEVEWKDD